MPFDSSLPNAGNASPHPLARALMERLAPRQGARVLEIGAGSGRNTRALVAAGFHVTNLRDTSPADRFDAALSTHALLHGTVEDIATTLAHIASVLAVGAPLYATFGSVRDARYGEGDAIASYTFAPTIGDEIGVAHTFFTEERLRALLARHMTIESLDERIVDTIAGSWAHQQQPLHGAVHWFAVTRCQK